MNNATPPIESTQSGIINSPYFFYTAQIQCIQDQSVWTNHNKKKNRTDPEETVTGVLIYTALLITQEKAKLNP